MNHENQIPIWGYINFQIFYELHLAIQENQTAILTINELIERTNKRIGSSPPLTSYFGPINSGANFGFLYTTLVVPKELNSLEYYEGIEIQVNRYFDLDFGNKDLFESNHFYRILRNSISHVNYKILSDNNSIRLWNKNKNGQKNIAIKTDLTRQSNFAIELAKYFSKSKLK